MSATVPFFVYEISTGEIVSTGFAPADQVAAQAGGTFGTAVGVGNADLKLDSANPVTGKLVTRPVTAVPHSSAKTSVLADGVDEGWVEGLPQGTRAERGSGFVVMVGADGRYSLTMSRAKELSVTFYSVGYAPLEITFTGG